MKTVNRDDTEHGVEYVTRAEAEAEVAIWQKRAKANYDLKTARRLLGLALADAIREGLQCEEEIRDALDCVDAALTWGDKPKQDKPQAPASQDADGLDLSRLALGLKDSATGRQILANQEELERMKGEWLADIAPAQEAP